MTHTFMRIICDHCGETKDVPVYCGDRFCPICSGSRQRSVRERLKFILDNKVVPKSYRLKMLTLTIPNQSDASVMIRTILKSFRRLRQRQYWKNHVHGGAYVVEMTGRPGNWHAHVHVIMVSRWMKWEKLLRIWQAVSPGRGVWIDDIPENEAVSYVTKYISKSSIPDDFNLDVNLALKGVRMFSPFGSWHSINRTYVKPLLVCSACSIGNFMSMTMMLDGHFSTFELEIERPPPELAVTTNELSV